MGAHCAGDFKALDTAIRKKMQSTHLFIHPLDDFSKKIARLVKVEIQEIYEDGTHEPGVDRCRVISSTRPVSVSKCR